VPGAAHILDLARHRGVGVEVRLGRGTAPCGMLLSIRALTSWARLMLASSGSVRNFPPPHGRRGRVTSSWAAPNTTACGSTAQSRMRGSRRLAGCSLTLALRTTRSTHRRSPGSLPLPPKGDAANAASAQTTSGNVALGRRDIAPTRSRLDHPTTAVTRKRGARSRRSRSR
jgi:hypothetical protein